MYRLAYGSAGLEVQPTVERISPKLPEKTIGKSKGGVKDACCMSGPVSTSDASCAYPPCMLPAKNKKEKSIGYFIFLQFISYFLMHANIKRIVLSA
jgi:hypothetical protein